MFQLLFALVLWGGLWTEGPCYSQQNTTADSPRQMLDCDAFCHPLDGKDKLGDKAMYFFNQIFQNV